MEQKDKKNAEPADKTSQEKAEKTAAQPQEKAAPVKEKETPAQEKAAAPKENTEHPQKKKTGKAALSHKEKIREAKEAKRRKREKRRRQRDGISAARRQAIEKREEQRRAYYAARRRGNHAKLIVGYFMIALAIVMSITWAGMYFYQIQKPDATGSVTLEIPANATGAEIADILAKNEVITSPTVFRIALAVKGSSNTLQSGHYRLQKGMTVKEAINALHQGQNDFATVTIPEGYTAAQIADLLQKAGVSSAGQFLEEASNYGPLNYMYGPETPLVKGEGFLFPDTYDIPKDYTARQICDLMYNRTDEILTPEIRKQAEEKGMSLHDLMTIASMVEREAKFKEDQVPIASVILKRLSIHMPLQIDATIQYILGEPKAELSVSDTRIQSPYNTYMREGLPPGPIGAPGLDAIKAVLKAQPGEYLYYVAKPDGHHVFTKTLEEHQAEINKAGN
jgi:UPF0755 protein